MRPVIVFSTALGLTLATLQLLHAQGFAGERTIPVAVSQTIGALDATRFSQSGWGIFAADFAEIANVPSTTELSLKVFLGSSHKSMPNFILQPEETDDIVAYILSLRRK